MIAYEDAVFPKGFRERVIRTETCWTWTGAKSSTGYGTMGGGGTPRGVERIAHRIAYKVMKGEIPAGLELDHLCRNRLCVNPAHLEAVTRRENVLRGASLFAKEAKQTHCKKGHAYTPDNTYTQRQGKRQCRACMAAHNATRRWINGAYQRKTP